MAAKKTKKHSSNPINTAIPTVASVDMTLDLSPGKRIQVRLEAMLPGDPPQVHVEEISARQPAPLSRAVEIPASQVALPPVPQTVEDGIGVIKKTQASSHQPGESRPEKKPFIFLSTILGRFKEPPDFISRHPGLALFILAMLIYFVTRVIDLAGYPIYFFCDEAIVGNLAVDLVRDGFRDYGGMLLPTYFKDGSGPFCLSTTVYLQLIPTLIFGKQVFVTRLVEVLVGLLAPFWLGLTLRDIFKIKIWWCAPLVLAAVPGWFIHSRIAFGYSLMAAFYAGFLYYYLRYRLHNPGYLYPSLILGALAFYTYSSGQMVMVVSGLFLLGLDWRYHWQNRKTARRGLALLVLLALPQVRFMIARPGDYTERFQLYASYWVQDLSLPDKLRLFFEKYLMGLNPLYLFFPGLGKDELIYTMKGYAPFHWSTLPLVVLGLVWTIRNWRHPEVRALWVAFLAAPTNAALVEITFRRAISIVVPIVLLTILGLSLAVDWLAERRVFKAYFWVSSSSLGALVFVVFALGATGLTWDALVNGPTWFNDYGLSGMQYGARQVFSAAKDYQEKHPADGVFISPNWTFQMNQVIRYFLPDNSPVKIDTPDRALSYYDRNLAKKVFVLTPSDYNRAINSGKIKSIQVEQVINTPDGNPGFYFGRLAYLDEAQQILEQEIKQRQELQSEVITLSGERLLTHHSQLEGPSAQFAFDGNPESLIKTREANPLVIEFEFPQPETIKGLRALVGAGHVRLTAMLNITSSRPEKAYSIEAPVTEANKDVELLFDEPQIVRNLRFELTEVEAGTPATIHLWELWLEKAP